MSKFSDGFLATMISGKTTEGDAITATSLNVTKFVSFFVAIFAGITQLLTSTNVVGLSTTQMVTIWLVVAGLVVLLGITDMICRAYVTGKQSIPTKMSELRLPVEVRTPEGGHRDAVMHGIDDVDGTRFAQVRYNEQDQDKWVAFDDIIQANN